MVLLDFRHSSLLDCQFLISLDVLGLIELYMYKILQQLCQFESLSIIINVSLFKVLPGLVIYIISKFTFSLLT